MEGLQAFRGFRNNNIIFICLIDHILNEISIQKRHITGRHKYIIAGGKEKTGVNSPQGTLILNNIRDDGAIMIEIVEGRVGGQDYFLKDILENPHCSVDEALAVNFKERLICSHSPIFSAR